MPIDYVVLHIYSWLLRLYPRPFVDAFGVEMRTVFKYALADAGQRGQLAVIATCLRELQGLVINILKEHLKTKMQKSTLIQNTFFILILWTLASMAGWAFSPLITFTPALKTYQDVAIHLVLHALYGAGIGIVAGAIQTIALKLEAPALKGWLWHTCLGYALMASGGLFISTLISALIFNLKGLGFLPFTQPGSISFYPYPMDIIYGGFILGSVQWLSLRHILPVQNAKLTTLWILSTGVSIWVSIMSWGVAFFPPTGSTVWMPTESLTPSQIVAYSLSRLLDFSLIVARLKMGAVSGLMQGLFLLIIMRQSASADSASQALESTR